MHFYLYVFVVESSFVLFVFAHVFVLFVFAFAFVLFVFAFVFKPFVFEPFVFAFVFVSTFQENHSPEKKLTAKSHVWTCATHINAWD